MKGFETFVFEDYQFERESGELTLKYSFDGELVMEEKLLFPMEGVDWERVNLVALKAALDNLHLIGGISYYKALLPKKLVLKKGQLDPEQAAFWNRLWKRGLGEFFYQNQIDFRGLIEFPFDENVKNEGVELKLGEKSLVPIGGGKDSLVTAEILDAAGEDFVFFSLRDAKPIRETAEILGKKRLIVERKLDEKLMELNEDGAWNGHVPITAYISFLLVVVAIIYDYKYLIWSLEASADFGQLSYLDMDINHQYSKSYEFEEDFHDYVKRYVSPSIEHFSLLRGFDEIKIAEIFARTRNFEKYQSIFTSCNSNFRIKQQGEKVERWCKKCPKCAFVFAILAPFVERTRLERIFEGNMFEDESLIPLFKELMGLERNKPFECVGNPEEVIAALYMVYKGGGQNDTAVMKMFEREVLGQLPRPEAIVDEVLGRQDGVLMPGKFKDIVHEFS